MLTAPFTSVETDIKLGGHLSVSVVLVLLLQVGDSQEPDCGPPSGSSTNAPCPSNLICREGKCIQKQPAPLMPTQLSTGEPLMDASGQQRIARLEHSAAIREY